MPIDIWSLIEVIEHYQRVINRGDVDEGLEELRSSISELIETIDKQLG